MPCSYAPVKLIIWLSSSKHHNPVPLGSNGMCTWQFLSDFNGKLFATEDFVIVFAIVWSPSVKQRGVNTRVSRAEHTRGCVDDVGTVTDFGAAPTTRAPLASTFALTVPTKKMFDCACIRVWLICLIWFLRIYLLHLQLFPRMHTVYVCVCARVCWSISWILGQFVPMFEEPEVYADLVFLQRCTASWPVLLDRNLGEENSECRHSC